MRISSWPPTRSKDPLLQHAQQLDLELERHVADLVEEDGAAVGQLELAEPPVLGVGEGALLVAEQLGLEEGRGKGGGGVPTKGRPARRL